MNSKEILVVGSAALDSVESPAGKVDDALGGSSFFFSTAASLLAPVRLVAVIGTDFPMEKIEFLKSRDVDMSGLMVEEGATFRWGGKYYADPNKRDTLFTELGVFETFDPEIPEHYRKTPLIFLGNIHPSLQLKVLEQIENPELVVLDSMNLWIDIALQDLEEVIRKVDVLIINDEEAMQLTGKTDLLSSADDLFMRGLQTLVIKKGQHGASLFRKDGEMFFLPAFPVLDVKDPTGAGDTFAGGFMGYLSSHDLADPMTWRRAVVEGSIIASFVVEDFSMDRTKILTSAEIDARREKFRDLVRF
jgi:sugar/nucleoside kinase (ribokinase family)